MAAGPLQGVRIVDLGTSGAARLAATILADLGADGVLVADKAGNRPVDAILERGRRRVSDPDAATLLTWFERCDVVIDDGELARRGLEPELIRVANPAAVVLSLPFDPGDPDAPGSAEAAGSLAGVYAPPLQLRPRFSPIPIVETVAGLHGALGVLGALVARERDGRGQIVRAPLLDAAHQAVELLVAMSDRPPSVWTPLHWAACPFVGLYRASDGNWIFAHLGLRAHVDRFCEVLTDDGLIRWVTDFRRQLSDATRADPSAIGSPTEAREVRRLLGELFESRPAEHWEELLGGRGLCCARVRTGAEWRSSELAVGAGHVVELDDPILGASLQPGPWIRVGTEPRVRTTRRPSWRERRTHADLPRDDRPPLDGVRVLDLTQVIAGPVAGRALAELGADVIRIEHPEFRPAWSAAFHAVFNAGKQSVEVDLKRERAATLLEALRPDLVLTNWRPGVDERLGLDPDSIREVCPDAVVVRLDAWGRGGPWEGRPGWEQTVQAACGLQADYGAPVPELVPLPVNDEATGLAASVGAVAALLGRTRGRRHLDVHTSLAATATWLQREWLFEPSGRTPRRSRGASLGADDTHRFVRARDGWIWLGGEVEDLRRLAGLEALADDGSNLDSLVAMGRRRTWEKRARRAVGVACARWRGLGAPGPTHRVSLPGLGRLTLTDPPLHLDRTPIVRPGPASPRGADRSLLDQADVSARPAEPTTSRTLPERLVRRVRWAADTARWGAYVASTRLIPALALALIAGCGGGGASGPLLPPDRPFEPLGTSEVQGSSGSNGGHGLSASARPIRDLALDVDGEGRLRVSWVSGELRVRRWDGSSWSDDRVPLKEPGGRSARPWEVGLGPVGPVALGLELPGATAISPPDLSVMESGSEQPHSGRVDGAWAFDPKGRLVLAAFAGPRVRVWRQTDEGWETLGDDTVPRGYRAAGRQGPTLAFDSESNPVVAWRESYTVPPDKDSADRFKTTRWRTEVRRWTGSDWTRLARNDLDEDPSKYPQSGTGVDGNPRAEWEAAQKVPPSLAVLADDSVVVAWDTLEGIEVWRHDGRAFSALPEPVDLAGDARDVHLVAHGQGAAIAWSHQWQGRRQRHPREIQVRVWDGESWSSPGGIHETGASATPGPSVGPRLAEHDGQLAVAWVDTTSGAQEVLLSRFDTDRWVGLPEGERAGGLGDPSRASSLPAITSGLAGPRVAWIEELAPGIPPGKARVELAWWTGAAWEQAPGIDLPTRPFGLEIGAAGDETLVLWDQRSGKGARGLFVGRFDGETWEKVPGKMPSGALARNADGGGYDAGLAVDDAGRPWVAWSHAGRAIQIRQWDGTAWRSVGVVPGQSVVGYAPRIRLGERGRPWLLWHGASANRDHDLKLGWFDGTDWQTVGDSWWLGCEANLGSEPPVEADLELDASGRPVVAWVSAGAAPAKRAKGKSKARARLSEPPVIHVCSWDGRQWQSLPPVARGASLRVVDTRRAHFDLTAADGPVVAWSEGEEGSRQVRIKRWTGERWLDLGDRDGQVSDCDGACWSPAMTVAEGHRCVAYEEMASGGRNISVRCQR